MNKLYKVTVENDYSKLTRINFIYSRDELTAELGSGVMVGETAVVQAIPVTDLGVGNLNYKRLPSASEMADFYDGLVQCLSIGTNLLDSLSLVSLQQKSPLFKGIIGEILSDLKVGKSFSQSIKNHESIFSDSTVSIIEAGETSGELPNTFKSLSISERRTHAVIKKIKAGLTYPILIITMAIFAVIFISIKLVPALESTYAQFDASLPKSTQFVIAFSDLLRNSPMFWIISASIFVYLFIKKNAIFRSQTVQTLLQKSPVIGDLYNKIIMAKVFRVLSMLISGGIRINRAFEITANIAGKNLDIKKALTSIGNNIVNGDELYVAFAKSQKVLGKDSQRIIAFLRLATHTGDPTVILERIAETYEGEVDAKTSTVEKMIEPVLLVFVATIIGGLIFAVYYPVFDLGQQVLAN